MGHCPQSNHHRSYRHSGSFRSGRLQIAMRTITLLIVHCSATPQGVALGFEDCRRNHIHHRGFRDIGYHFYLTRNGEIRASMRKGSIGGSKRLPSSFYHPHYLKCLGQVFAYGIAAKPGKGFQCLRRARMRKSTALKLIGCHGSTFCFQIILRNLHIEIGSEMAWVASSLPLTG